MTTNARESDMHPDLEWLARNETSWEGTKGFCLIGRDENGVFYATEDCDHAYTYNQWLQARKDLGLVMSDSEEEIPAPEWAGSVPDGVKAPFDGMTASKYNAYFKDVRHINTLDVYRVVSLFDCEKHGHPISHAAKKLLLSGSRTGGKDVEEDVREAIDTLHRWLEMREEDRGKM